MADITAQVINLVETSNYDEDIKQDFYVRWLERTEPVNDVEDLVHLILLGLYSNRSTKENNRVRLQVENEETIRNLYNYNDVPSDPLDVALVEELEDEILGGLSELEKDIYARVIGNGLPYKDVAEELDMSEEAVRKHVSRIKGKYNGKTHH